MAGLARMVTTAVAEEVFPLPSVTVRVTVFVPIFLQVKFVGLNVIVLIPQLSVLPLLTCEGVIVILPEVFNSTVIF